MNHPMISANSKCLSAGAGGSRQIQSASRQAGGGARQRASASRQALGASRASFTRECKKNTAPEVVAGIFFAGSHEAALSWFEILNSTNAVSDFGKLIRRSKISKF